MGNFSSSGQICVSPGFVIYMSNNLSSNCSCHLRRLVLRYKGEISLHFNPPSRYNCCTSPPLNDHHLTKLYILNTHARVVHDGVKAAITEHRLRFWLVKGRSAVKKSFETVLGKKYEGQDYQISPPPPLPSFRVQEAPPLSHTGVDIAGPLYVNHPGSKQAKVWIALFTCCMIIYVRWVL